MVKYLSFHHSCFALRYLARPQCDTPLVEVIANCQKLAQLAVFDLLFFGNASEAYFY
jgi:hypothetical protein